MKILFWGLLVYFLYKLIFNVVVPASKMASQMKDKVREMQQQQEAAREQFEQYQQQAPKTPETKKGGDYIEFEEIR